VSDRELLIGIGGRIRRARLAARMTQAGLAEAAGVVPSSVSLWELARNGPTACNVIRLAEALKVTAGWLLGEGAEQ